MPRSDLVECACLGDEPRQLVETVRFGSQPVNKESAISRRRVYISKLPKFCGLK